MLASRRRLALADASHPGKHQRAGQGSVKAWWLATTNRWRTTSALHRSPTKPGSLQSDQRTLEKRRIIV
ncbi:hypothetical protein VITFI_CDS0794 [Vitreoscilla filiformis]|uniref:Uncharacterized protein n=1 Tax=Vitreoscilla filiformis TaxID=63 RepID=A0A221KC21_VITFI|nr:hypothetical protein VITFI_CDS0794 [Vitreoscilla filiformis]